MMTDTTQTANSANASIVDERLSERRYQRKIRGQKHRASDTNGEHNSTARLITSGQCCQIYKCKCSKCS